MIWGIRNGERVTATPGGAAVCPCCQARLVSHCGPIIPAHWEHTAKNCDPWAEPETEWHRSWKRLFPIKWQEILIGNHRADICTPSGFVIEFQHSSISLGDVSERCN